MRLVDATLYALRIPFVEAFRHSVKERSACDSVVVRVRDEVGNAGFGEGVPRPYVTGETADAMLAYLAGTLWPAVAGREVPSLHAETDLAALDAFIPQADLPGALAGNASRGALELAILDCALQRAGLPLARLLPPRRDRVVYSGVITAGPLEQALQHARQMRLVGLAHIKVKVGFPDDVERVRAIRAMLGDEVSIRLDANGAWSVPQATETLARLAPLRIDCVEQPLPRGPLDELLRLKAASPVPLMADESLVTFADAEALAGARAVDFFNVRVSKCGGLHRSLEIGRVAARAGIRVQVGCQVGETALLSAAGRHLAAALDEVTFVEGSFGTLLLVEDVSRDAVRFGYRGVAPLLRGSGLGVEVVEERLRRWAVRTVEL